MNNKVIANICFQQPVKHITTWFQKRINPITKIVINIYNLTDHIIQDQKEKKAVTAARSYGGTETPSDHKLVEARM